MIICSQCHFIQWRFSSDRPVIRKWLLSALVINEHDLAVYRQRGWHEQKYTPVWAWALLTCFAPANTLIANTVFVYIRVR